MRAFAALTKVETLLFLRNPTSVFMALLLPSLLLLLQAFVIPGTMEPIGGTDPALAMLRPMDFFVPVSVAVALASVAITNYPSSVGAYREAGVLRRLGVTPIGAHRVLFAQWAVSGLSLGSALLIALFLARFAFDAVSPRNVGMAVLVIFMGTITMMALGSLIAAVAASAQIAYGLGLLVFMACMFTAGMWTPGPLMSDAIRTISSVTPMGAMTQALTDAWYSGAVSVAPFIVMILWTLPTGALALKVFKWV